MAKKNDIIELKAQLSEKKLQKLYVFYGDEEYLKEHYIKKIEELVPDGGLEEFNRIKLSGITDYGVYDDALEGMPMMAERRTLLIRDSNIFTTRRSGSIIPPNDDQKKFWQDKFSRLSEDTVLIFCEKNADARSALLKAAGKVGMLVKCDYLPESELASWAVRRAARVNKKLDNADAQYLVSIIDPGMNSLENELNKLLCFCGDKIYRSDIDRVVSKSMAVQIFDITDGITENNPEKVFGVINELKTQKESAFGILYLIYANAEKMLRLKLAGITNRNEAAKLLGGSPWIAAKYLEGAAKFPLPLLIRMVTGVPEADYDIKYGKISEWQALEQYIFEAMQRGR